MPALIFRAQVFGTYERTLTSVFLDSHALQYATLCLPRLKTHQSFKLLSFCVLAFIVCWSPYFIYDLLQVFDYIKYNETTFAVATFIQSLAPLNSAANPIIYCFFTTTLYRNLRKLQFCNWLAKTVCFCFPSLQRPLRETNSSRTSENTMAESLTRFSRWSYGSRFSLKSNPTKSIQMRHIVERNETKPKALKLGSKRKCSEV
ncbi:cardioacceleratory peptide receptor-like [Limulus polyphemus]|uniref:Cardioacceleratory peptide receptor-like n=1 Tax=Limulus polyphemus TaxID=6850 RepID=A0ABM1TQ23_LIMPO|nr:cardioacceleratory peptide receptor-like [Limulus polyphemus]